MGAMGRFVGGFDAAASGQGGNDLAALLARLRRDPEVTAEMRERFGPIELAWRRETADNLERTAELTNGLDMRAMMMNGMNGGESDAVAAVRKVAEELREIDQRAYRAVAVVIGQDKSDLVFSRQRPFADAEGAAEVGQEVLAPNLATAAEPEPEAPELADQPGYMGSAAFFSGPPPAWTAAQIARMLKPLGVPDSSLAVIEGIVDGWTAREWQPKVASFGAEFGELSDALYRQREDGGLGIDPSKAAKMTALRLRMVDAVIAADAVLFDELATALGFGADSAEILLLRLERVQLAAEPMAMGGPRYIASPSAILARASLSPEASRAFLEGSRDAWKAFAQSFPADVRGVVERSDRQQMAMQDAGTSRDFSEFQRIMTENTAAARDFIRRYGELCDAAASKAGGGAEAATAIRRARLALSRPDVYKSSDCATRQLAAALALDGVSDDQRARLEALKAEYDAVYEMLSEKIAVGSEEVDPADGEAWRAMQERMEAEEKLRFQRNERTEKARSEARRILGDELASRVRGLVPDEADPSAGRRAAGFNPFLEDED
jgi:hypothetical protein